MRIGVLGPLEIDGETARLGMRDRVVLEALAITPGELLTPDQLADALWADGPPASWSKNLQGCISRLRKLLGPGAIETSREGYRLCLPADSVDAVEFVRRVDRARELLLVRDPERAGYAADEALRLWRGRPLTGLEEWAPGMAQVARLTEVYADAEELVVEAALAAGHHRDVVSRATAMVQAAPLREQRWALLARAQYQSGRQADALRTLHRMRTVLREELGLDPGPDIEQLEQAILRQDPTLLVPEAPPAADEQCPYRGLAPYGEDDADSFFGRDDDVAACLDRLAERPVLAVVGPSGSGKSSLVRAGVAAALRAQGRPVRVLTPGPRPMDALTPPPRHDTVLVVDQAEEVFSLCADEAERHRFLDALVTHSAHAPVVVALRADWTGGLVAHPAFARLAERGLHLLGPMSEESLRTAIERPARQAGLVVEQGLVDLLVREVEGEPGALPLLSHALRETWLRREGRSLTIAGYRASGGIRGAVAQSAEALYHGVGAERRDALRDLMLRLVVPSPEGEPVRERVPRHQLVTDPEQQRLLDELVGARLLTSDAGSVELAHEALARAWPRLRGWLQEDLEGQHLRHRLTRAAEDWDAAGRQDTDLYRGARLSAVQQWREQTDAHLTDLERAFLAAGDRLARAEERSAQELARARGRMIRRLRWSLAGTAALLAVALVAGFVAVGQTGRARDEADAARARQLSAQALGDADIPLSALLAVAAVRIDDTAQTRASLATVLARHPALVATSDPIGDSGNGNGAERLVRSPDGTRLATENADNVVSLVDTATGRVSARYDADGAGVDDVQFFAWSALAFSPNGRTLAVGSPNYGSRGVELLDGTTLRPLPDQPTHLPRWRAKACDVSFSANGRFLAASFLLLAPGYHEGGPESPALARTLVWDVSRLHRAPRVLDIPFHGYTMRMALSPDGRRVYVSSPVSAYDVATGHRLWRRPGNGTWQPMDLSADGTHLAVISGDFQNAVDVLDTTHRGRLETTLTKDAPGTFDDVAFSDDGATVAAVGGSASEHNLFVWDPSVPQPTQTIPIDGSAGVQLNPRATRAYVSDVREGTMVTWDLTGNASYLRQEAVHPELRTIQVGFMLPSPDGSHFTEYADDLQLFDATAGRLVTAAGARDWGYYTPGSWRPDGHRFVAAGRKGWVQVFGDDGHLVREARVAKGAVTAVDYSADGATVAVSEASGRVGLWDAQTLETVGTPVQLPGTAAAATLAPDGRTAFVVTRRTAVAEGGYPQFQGWALLDLRNGAVLRTGQLPDSGPNFADFSPDGDHVAVGFASGRVAVLAPRAGTTLAAPAPEHQTGIGWLSWSHDGSRIISADWNGDLELWDPTTGEVQDTVTTPGGAFAVGQFRQGSSHVTIVDVNGRVFDWDPSRQHALDAACTLASRDLTDLEWRTYLGDQPKFEVCPT